MSNIKILLLRRGNAATAPLLHDGEVGYCRDTNELIIGTATGNRTFTIDGGNLLDNKGNITIKHGRKLDFVSIKPYEFIYFDDTNELVIGLEHNTYNVIYKPVASLSKNVAALAPSVNDLDNKTLEFILNLDERLSILESTHEPTFSTIIPSCTIHYNILHEAITRNCFAIPFIQQKLDTYFLINRLTQDEYDSLTSLASKTNDSAR